MNYQAVFRSTAFFPFPRKNKSLDSLHLWLLLASTMSILGGLCSEEILELKFADLISYLDIENFFISDECWENINPGLSFGKSVEESCTC